MKLAFIDFEFRGISNQNLDLVCVAILATENTHHKYQREFWLWDNTESERAKAFILKLIREGYLFVSYVVEAEARSLMTLFQKEIKQTKFIDLYLEYRCLLNHNHQLQYGMQYINGKILETSPPPSKWDLTEGEEDNEAHHKPSYSLAAACYKLLGIKIDAVEKAEARDIIINHPDKLLENRKRIQDYCMSDVVHLPLLLNAAFKQFKDRGIFYEEWLKGALSRGDYAIATAKMIREGYPVNLEKVSMFTENIANILNAAIEDVLASDPERKTFEKDKKTGKYKAKEKAIRDFIRENPKPYWRKTDKGSLSISKDAFRDWYDTSSEGFPGAFCRYLSTKQSLNGFLPGGKKGSFKDHIGTDGRVRAYFGIYGAQSSRSQPGSTGYIFLKAHWLRVLIEAERGRALAGIDYASQEFLIAAILSQDTTMMAAYESGDVYLAFAKSAGLAPPEATKKSHKNVRDVCKALVLGISYDMSAKGLAPRLTKEMGETVSEEKAQSLIDLFYETYSEYKDWKDQVLRDYQDDDYLTLSDGWIMWGDNDNRRSVGNFPVQGHGAVIMREAVKLCQSKGLRVCSTLHDALYIEYDAFDFDKVKLLMSCMQEAFCSVMSNYGEITPIRLEGETWSKDYTDKDSSGIGNVRVMSEYVDDKGRKDYEKYKRYLQ